MTVSRATLIARAALRLGGHSGTLSFTSGVSTRAVLAGLVGTSDDDSMYVGWHLFMLDATNETDRERTVTEWDASTGTAGWEVARSDTVSTSETYVLVPDYSLDEFRQALNLALRESKRSYAYTLPLVPGITRYDLSALSWLEGSDDIDSVWVGQSPNLLHNEDFTLWQNGSALAPDGWTLAGSDAAVARVATGIHSPYAARVTRATADATLYQSVPAALVQYLTRSANAPLPLISFGAWVTSSTASIARVGVYNGSTTTWASYHTGNGVPQFLSSTYQMTAADTALRLVLSVNTSAGAADFHRGVLCPLASIPDQLKDRGSGAYLADAAYAAPRNVGGLPVIDLASSYGYGQIIVHSRRQFPEMTADTDVVEDQYADALQAGLLRWLLDAMKPNQDRTRLDRIRGEEAAKWTRANKKFISKPVEEAPRRVTVMGA